MRVCGAYQRRFYCWFFLKGFSSFVKVSGVIVWPSLLLLLFIWLRGELYQTLKRTRWIFLTITRFLRMFVIFAWLPFECCIDSLCVDIRRWTKFIKGVASVLVSRCLGKGEFYLLFQHGSQPMNYMETWIFIKHIWNRSFGL